MPSFHAFFRELFQTFLGDFIQIAEPDFAGHLLAEQARFPILDLSGWTDEERAAAGAVADVPTRDGDCVTVLIHSEPGPLGPAEVSRRLGRYFVGLETKYAQPVILTAVYLRGGRPGLNLESVPVNQLLDVEMARIFYTTFGLAESRAEHYLERPEPLAWALAALMRPVRQSPAEHRRACLRRIAEAGLPDRETALLTADAEPGGVFSVDRSGPGLPVGVTLRYKGLQEVRTLMIKYLVPLAVALAMPVAQGTLHPRPEPAPAAPMAPAAPSVSPTAPADPLAEAPRISAADAKKALDAGKAVLVDVRSMDAWQDEHAKGAVSIPVNELYARMGELPKNKQIIAYCT